mmetsp:Transcript_15576/g.47026  ORF Transcript_15576/g.47026 Transcript_15576/m.47026 type:complete len:218 (-) Transcript_15576:168-821(-)
MQRVRRSRSENGSCAIHAASADVNPRTHACLSLTFFPAACCRYASRALSSWLPRTHRAPSWRTVATTAALCGPLLTRSPTSTSVSPWLPPSRNLTCFRSACSSSRQPCTSPTMTRRPLAAATLACSGLGSALPLGVFWELFALSAARTGWARCSTAGSCSMRRLLLESCGEVSAPAAAAASRRGPLSRVALMTLLSLRLTARRDTRRPREVTPVRGA